MPRRLRDAKGLWGREWWLSRVGDARLQCPLFCPRPRRPRRCLRWPRRKGKSLGSISSRCSGKRVHAPSPKARRGTAEIEPRKTPVLFSLCCNSANQREWTKLRRQVSKEHSHQQLRNFNFIHQMQTIALNNSSEFWNGQFYHSFHYIYFPTVPGSEDFLVLSWKCKQFPKFSATIK